MGFGTSASHIILFIATIILASSVAYTLSVTTGKIAIGIEEKGRVMKKYLSGDMEIINDPLRIPIKSGEYVFYVKNTGERSLTFTNSTVDVLIDGSMIVRSHVTIITPSSGILGVSETGEIRVNITLTSGDHRVKIIVDGISDTMTFRV